nr:rod shape-determining protein MreC [uncultured Lichenicoccus sp.]
MIRLSIQTRQALSRTTLPVLVVWSLALMLLGQADRRLAVQARAVLADALAPAYSVLHVPVFGLRSGLGEARGLFDLARENHRLRAENRRLLQWRAVALAATAENAALKASLHWLPDPAAHVATARVVAETGGLYARAFLVNAGSLQGLHKGDVVMDAQGLVGRITETGSRSARVLLVTDIASRVPVMLEASHANAMLAGVNRSAPRLLYYPDDVRPEEGERVLTSSEAGAFPAGLPVGVVHYRGPGDPVVLPAADLDRLDLIRVVDFGLSAIAPPDAPGRVVAHARPGAGLLLPADADPHPGPRAASGPASGEAPGAGQPVPIGRG